VQTILRGLKKYGMMVADNGGDWYVGGAPDPRWDDEALHSFDQVTGADFEVVDSRALLPGAFCVNLPATATAREGTPWVRAGSFFDGAGALWTATVDYGAGGGAAPAPLSLAADKSFALAQTWPDDGRRDVRVVVTNDLAGTATTTVAVTVRNAAPKVMAGADARVRAGALLARACSFTDPGADTWTGVANWGDGSARTPLRLRTDKTFTLAHRFPHARGRSYTVVVTVRDDDGGRGTARFRVTLR